ncbi:transcriptional regulator [Halobacteriales archaeon QS_1_68_20]|nr:MAG: transcriptional regulator [Halobacteriales archaeon QS_1_68_20]
MRPRVPWMNEVDTAILEYFAELGAVDGSRVSLAPTPLYVNLVQRMGVVDVQPNTLSRRMSRLAAMGFLEKIDEKRGYYCLTEMGEAFLAGELDAEDIPRPEDN